MKIRVVVVAAAAVALIGSQAGFTKWPGEEPSPALTSNQRILNEWQFHDSRPRPTPSVTPSWWSEWQNRDPGKSEEKVKKVKKHRHWSWWKLRWTESV